MTLTAEQKQQIEKLAVAYSAFNEACHAREQRDIWLWGRMLREAQLALDIWLNDLDTLDRMIEIADRAIRDDERLAEIRAETDTLLATLRSEQAHETMTEQVES